TGLGSDRMTRKLQAALPAGESPLREAVWQLMRPMLSPHLSDINRDAFVLDTTLAPAADLQTLRADSALADIDLGDEQSAAWPRHGGGASASRRLATPTPRAPPKQPGLRPGRHNQ